MSATSRQDDGFRGQADDFYEALIRAHEGLSDEESGGLNARLVLVLAHEVGDLDKLGAAIRLARGTVLADRRQSSA